MIWLDTPALALSVTIRMMRLRPESVGDQPSTLCRYIGRKILSPIIEPQPKQFDRMARRAAGSDRMEIGMSGSIAVRSRTTKAAPSRSAHTTSATTGRDHHGYRTPPRLSASINDELAAMIRMAP